MKSTLENCLMEIRRDLQELKEALVYLPEWVTVSAVADQTGLTPQAIRKRLYSGSFEPEVDFKYMGTRIVIARSAVSKLQRIRK